MIVDVDAAPTLARLDTRVDRLSLEARPDGRDLVQSHARRQLVTFVYKAGRTPASPVRHRWYHLAQPDDRITLGLPDKCPPVDRDMMVLRTTMEVEP